MYKVRGLRLAEGNMMLLSRQICAFPSIVVKPTKKIIYKKKTFRKVVRSVAFQHLQTLALFQREDVGPKNIYIYNFHLIL